MADYTILDDVSPEDPMWKEWTGLVEEEYWLADDRTVTTLTPSEFTTHSVTAKDKNGTLIGVVIWNEYDNLAWIGFYLLKEDYRGKGIGSVLWEKAMDRIKSTGLPIGLRGVPLMANKYKAKDFPYERDIVSKHMGGWESFTKFAKRYAKKNANQWDSGNVDEAQLSKIFKFDSIVTGRNREDFLRKFLSLPFTHCSCLENEAGEVIAMSFITTTGPPRDNYFKVAPIYAATLEDAMTVSLPLFEYAGRQNKEAKVLVNVVNSIGREELEPLMTSEQSIDSNLNAMWTLFTAPYEEQFRQDLMFAPHNNSIHYDA